VTKDLDTLATAPLGFIRGPVAASCSSASGSPVSVSAPAAGLQQAVAEGRRPDQDRDPRSAPTPPPERPTATPHTIRGNHRGKLPGSTANRSDKHPIRVQSWTSVHGRPRCRGALTTRSARSKPLISSFRALTARDPQQEVQGFALPVLDAVIESVRAACRTTGRRGCARHHLSRVDRAGRAGAGGRRAPRRRATQRGDRRRTL
jgi:hypothetical protein